MERFNIEAVGIEFKNLFSGPAPVGRILNYVYKIGNDGLKHKNGYRSLDASEGIGYAWTTEFMIGLGLARLGDAVGTAFILELTDKGRQLYELMEGNPTVFDEGSRATNIRLVKSQMRHCHPALYETFKQIFVESFPFLILREYLFETTNIFTNKRAFYDEFFLYAGEVYGEGSSESNAGFNRVPSLIQLCQLFDLATDDAALRFDIDAVESVVVKKEDVEYTANEMKRAVVKEKVALSHLRTIQGDLEETYGQEGNVLVEMVVRNSALQTMFKHNLMVSQHGCCVVCGMQEKALLIGSHIKASSKSNVREKIDHNNGLLLCCNHDRVFDRHLITFDAQTGRIRISRALTLADLVRLGLSDDFVLSPELLTEERKEYLAIHNKLFEEKEAE